MTGRLNTNDPAYLGLLFLDGTLRGRVPVALGRCFHCIVFVVMLQICGREVEERDKEERFAY